MLEIKRCTKRGCKKTAVEGFIGRVWEEEFLNGTEPPDLKAKARMESKSLREARRGKKSKSGK